MKPNQNNESIYNLTRLYYAVVKVEPPKPKRSVIQCSNCQEYGHSKNYCHKRARCVKCDGNHSTTKCTKPLNVPPICVNCKGQHTANYKGCPVHLKLQNTNNPKMPTKEVNSSINQMNFPPITRSPQSRTSVPQNLPSTVITPAASATALSNTLHERTSYTNAIKHKNEQSQLDSLICRIDSLLSLLQPLIQTLSQILPVLLSK